MKEQLNLESKGTETFFAVSIDMDGLKYINDTFGQSGKPAQLMQAYGLDAAHIVEAALSF